MNGLTYLKKSRSSDFSADEKNQLGIFWVGIQDICALVKTGWIELYNYFQLEYFGVLFIENLLFDV